jgi:hypothetical protein
VKDASIYLGYKGVRAMKNYLYKSLTICGVCLFLSTAQAATLTLTWTPPTEYEDGTPLFEQDLDYYTVHINGQPVANLAVVVGTWTADIVITAPGTHDVNMTVTDLNGETSVFSNTQVFTVGPRTPKAPVITAVVVQ